jgi:hypothetical protein
VGECIAPQNKKQQKQAQTYAHTRYIPTERESTQEPCDFLSLGRPRNRDRNHNPQAALTAPLSFPSLSKRWTKRPDQRRAKVGSGAKRRKGGARPKKTENRCKKGVEKEKKETEKWASQNTQSIASDSKTLEARATVNTEYFVCAT